MHCVFKQVTQPICLSEMQNVKNSIEVFHEVGTNEDIFDMTNNKCVN